MGKRQTAVPSHINLWFDWENGGRGEKGGDEGVSTNYICTRLFLEIQKFATHGNNRIRRRKREGGNHRRYSSGPISNTVKEKNPQYCMQMVFSRKSNNQGILYI